MRHLQRIPHGILAFALALAFAFAFLVVIPSAASEPAFSRFSLVQFHE